MRLVVDVFGRLGLSGQDYASAGLLPTDPIGSLSANGTRELARLAAPKLLERSGESIREMLPGLYAWRDHRISERLLRPRSCRALLRSGVATWGDVADLTPEMLFKLRGVGWVSAVDIASSSVRLSLEEPSHEAGRHSRVNSGVRKSQDPDSRRSQEPQAERADERNASSGGPISSSLDSSKASGKLSHELPIPSYDEDRCDKTSTDTERQIPSSGAVSTSAFKALAILGTLAAWGFRERNKRRLGDVLQVAVQGGPLPPDLAELLAGFRQIDLYDIADSTLRDVSLDDLSYGLAATMDHRQWNIFRRRLSGGSTLESLGSELGLSRQRIQQLQREAERQVAAALRTDHFRLLHWRAADLGYSLGSTAPIAHEVTRSAISRSLRDASKETVEIMRPLLLRMAGPYREISGWLTVNHANIDVSDVQDLANQFGIVSLAEVRKWLTDHGVRPEFHESWLERSGMFRQIGDVLMVWSGSVADKCIAHLAYRREPADTETLVALVGEGHSVRGTRNRLFSDDRLVRVNRTHWALRAWGMEEYSGIVDEISQRIGEAGGIAELSEVVDEIVRQFGVSENSVHAYTAAPMFVVEDGHIRMRELHEQPEVEASLDNCTGAFRSSAAVISLQVRVDADLLRGSGRALRGPIAAALGVTPGQPRSFQYETGNIRVTWPMTSALGPSLGSVRVLASTASAAEGERVRLDFNLTQGTVSAERIPGDLASYRDEEAIRLLTGIETTLDKALLEVADAINTTPINVRRALVDRGDEQLAELLPRPDVDSQLESTLSDLAQMMSRRQAS